MRKIIFWSLFLALLANGAALHGQAPAKQAAASTIERIAPPSWWVGMANPEVELMIHGEGIATAQPSLSYPGVQLLSSTRLESENYLFVKLAISPEAEPGELTLYFQLPDGERLRYEYALDARQRGARRDDVERLVDEPLRGALDDGDVARHRDGVAAMSVEVEGEHRQPGAREAQRERLHHLARAGEAVGHHHQRRRCVGLPVERGGRRPDRHLLDHEARSRALELPHRQRRQRQRQRRHQRTQPGAAHRPCGLAHARAIGGGGGSCGGAGAARGVCVILRSLAAAAALPSRAARRRRRRRTGFDHRLGLFEEVGRSLKTTNAIESLNSLVEEYIGNVKRWHHSEQRARWLALGLLAGLQEVRLGRWIPLVFGAGVLLGVSIAAIAPLAPQAPGLPLLSFIVLGVLVAVGRRWPLPLLLTLAAAVGLAQGYDNGLAVTPTTNVVLFVGGVVVSGLVVVLLVTATTSVGVASRDWTRVAVRAVGSWIAAAGVMVAGLNLAG